MDEIVEFVGPWDGQVVATSVHAGHEVRPELQPEMVLDEDTRLREEDPFTDRIASVVPSRMVTHRSRFEVDLNRPREEAVYREPDDCWGLDVWRDPPLSKELTEGSLAVYDHVYAALAERLDEVAARGPFVLLDVHSYNHRRDGAAAQPAPDADNPEVNVGTGSVNQEVFGPLVDRFVRALGEQVVRGHRVDARENVAFKGRALAWFVHTRYPGVGCVLALEFKKTWMDEWTGEVRDDHLEEIRAALTATLPVLEKSLADLDR
ncbi:N-formylglutamate amidohydrolase [Nocardioides daphniae]|uniref:N-formylglutamate amidohydrolase n=1 Tax=Nocardioides daphniae TaxID=402297 RepID=A0A4P7UIZ6_9ACTN|nr:N-formylglutamate amidohydrolase [Nocardioides daphniae]QCC78449.1 N-formylglutamate amidohydrolase [Nocardioides daphniae]GGD12340.1 hypothetical protein GCM10007231_09130 [Nocardioides daphniae]